MPISDKWKALIFLMLAFATAVPNFIDKHLVPAEPSRFAWEEFDQDLVERLQDIDALQAYCDSIRRDRQIEAGSLAHADLMARVLRKRFYHGYSHYAIQDNWVAAFSARIFWDHLSAIVLPNDILRYPFAACSQQEIVLMELFARNQIPYRKVLFNHHFALEAKFDSSWYFFDVNLEPSFRNQKRTSLDSIIQQNQLVEIYKDRLDVAKIDSILGPPRYGIINEFPAPRAKLFHQGTSFVSEWAWLLCTLFCAYYMHRHRKKQSSLNK